MVKIHNVFGDTWIGKYHDKIYQRVHGQQVRREGFKRPYPMSPVQELQKQKFQEFTEWWRSQTREDKETIKEQFKEEGIEQKDPKYPTAYHYLLGLGLHPINMKLVDSETVTYLIEHPCIYKIKEVDSNGNVIKTHDNLSDPYTFDFTSQYTLTPTYEADSIIVYTPFNHQEKFKLYVVPEIPSILYELIADLTFPTPTESFTVQNLQAYEQLYFLFSFDLQSSGLSDNSIILYPNGDTGANYTCILFNFNNWGTFFRNDYPSPNLHLCRVIWTTRSLNEGYAYLHTKPTGYWRALHTHFTINTYSQVHYEYEKQVGYWKNTTDPINNIQFKARLDGYGFTGWIKVYGLKEAV